MRGSFGILARRRARLAADHRTSLGPITLTVVGFYVVWVSAHIFMIVAMQPSDHCLFWTHQVVGNLSLRQGLWSVYTLLLAGLLIGYRRQPLVENIMQLLLLIGFLTAMEGTIAAVTDLGSPYGEWLVRHSLQSRFASDLRELGIVNLFGPADCSLAEDPEAVPLVTLPKPPPR